MCAKKKVKLENGGFDPPTSSLRTTRASDCANSPKAASIGTRTRLLCLEGIDTTPVLWTQHDREQGLSIQFCLFSYMNG